VFKESINREVTDSQSGFRAFTREALKKVVQTTSQGFGADAEQIHLATQNNLQIKEVPVHILYNGLDKTSKKNPFTHGTEILGNILKLVVNERPVELLGFPGLVSVAFGILGAVMFFFTFNNSGYFSIPLALISTATILFGSLLLIAALILYAINEVNIKNKTTTR
jgi:hypothetical protein